MNRGEIWTASGAKDYAGKPRPVVIVQSDRFDSLESMTVCPFTTDPVDAPLLRLAIEPSMANGLKEASRIMIDKLTTVPKTKLGVRVGRLEDREIIRLNHAVIVFLGLAD
jgi:mRNA interferase MazF